MPSIDKNSKPIKHIVKKDEIFNLLNTTYSDSFCNWKNNSKIYRGSVDIGKCCILETGKRKSKQISNIYTILLSYILPSWREYPKRSRSFICTTNIDIARTYINNTGRLYYVFPENNSKIGICPSYDIWRSFLYLQHESEYKIPDLVDIILDFIDFFLNYFNNSRENNKKYIKNLFATENIYDILNIFSTINKKIKSITSNILSKLYKNKDLYWLYSNICNNKYDIVNTLDYYMDSTKNMFKMCYVNDYEYDSDYFKREIWCGGNCLFVDKNCFDELMGATNTI